jgi:hypothetical protein
MADVVLNQVYLTGRVGKYKDYKALENGTCYAVISLGVKRGQSYSNFFIKFFNSPKNQIADRVYEELNEGEYIEISGKLVEQSFTPKNLEGQLDEKGRQKTVSKIEVYGFSFVKVYYDEQLEKYQTVD